MLTIKDAVKQLGIDVPVYRAERRDDGGLILHLRDEVIIIEPVPATDPDDFTAIPGIGKATAAALHAAGITTFQDLASTSYTDLIDLVKPHVANAINTYLSEHEIIPF